MASNLFYNPHKSNLKEIRKFRQLTKLAIKAHDEYIERLFNNIHDQR